MSKKRIVKIILVSLLIVGFVSSFIWYERFVMNHRFEIIMGCILGIIFIMGVQCARICAKSTKRINELLKDMMPESTVQNNAQSQPNKN